MSGLEFADKHPERTKYFICTLMALGYGKHPEGNCRRRICGRGDDDAGVALCRVGGRFYLWLLPQNEFDCRCTAGWDAVLALRIVDIDFTSFLEVAVVVSDIGLEASNFRVSEVKVNIEFLVLGIENDDSDFRLEGVPVGGDLYICFGILGGVDSPRAGSREAETRDVSHNPFLQ